MQRWHVVLPSEEDFESAAVYFRGLLDAEYRGRWDSEKGALAGDGPGWGHEQAAVAAAASGSCGTDAAKELFLCFLMALVGSRC